MLNETIIRALVDLLKKGRFPFMLDRRCYVLELREVTPEEYHRVSLDEARNGKKDDA